MRLVRQSKLPWQHQRVHEKVKRYRLALAKEGEKKEAAVPEPPAEDDAPSSDGSQQAAKFYNFENVIF